MSRPKVQPRVLDPEWEPFSPYFEPLKRLGDVPIQDIRNGIASLIQRFNEAVPTITEGLTVHERELTLDDGATIKIWIYVPQKTPTEESSAYGFPLLCWHFGGGYCTGTLNDDDKRLRRITTKLGITCTSIAYRLAPEHQYPIPLDDAFFGLKWVLSNARMFSINVHRGFLIGGFSAGGTIASALIQRVLKDESIQPKVSGQVLISPGLINPNAIPDGWRSQLLSLQEYADDGPILSTSNVKLFYNMYAGTNPDHLSNTEVSPLLMSSLANTPPTYIQICGCDPVRDEAVLYSRWLGEAAVPTKVQVYPDLPHGFQTFTPQFSRSWEQDKDFHEGVAWLLGLKHPSPRTLNGDEKAYISLL